MSSLTESPAESDVRVPSGPLALIAEVTHRCPLHCVYCSNPMELVTRGKELSGAAWAGIFEQAAALGVMQLDLTGGEPLARPDVVDLVRAARANGLYVNLITSGIGLNAGKLEELVGAGLDHLQLSFQDAEAAPADEFAGFSAHEKKLSLAREIAKQHRIAFTVNLVVHRKNLSRLEQMLAMAESLGAHRIEVAHVQYYGWAVPNRAELLPTREQVEWSLGVLAREQERLKGRIRLEYVTPDYYAKFPKACMSGWGRKLMVIDPAGFALPCHAARVIPGLQFENAADKALKWIWQESKSFNRFRGEEWMQEPCRSCDRRTVDFGGCRCQAQMIAGEAAVTDPVCSLSTMRPKVEAMVNAANRVLRDMVPAEILKEPSTSTPNWTYRPNPR
jgi:pyrroloquinoline quinone biosynthesis protein E